MATQKLTCGKCRTQLLPYLHHQLSPRMRRRVGQHLNECPLCYAAYLAQRDLADELSAGLPLVGRPDSRQMGRVWAAIQADMARPQPVARPQVGRFAVAWAVFVLALALPWSFDRPNVALAVPEQPSAPALSNEVTESPPRSVAVAQATAAAGLTNPVIPAAETPNVPPGTPDTR